jgi:hypothetical protein
MMFPAYANAFRMMEGDVLQYAYDRVSSTGGGQTGNVTFTIVSLNQTMVTLQVNATSGVEMGPVHIKYNDGIPIYADDLDVLVYLPPECVARSLQGKLEWLTNLELRTSRDTVVNGTSQAQSFKVAAGSFQSLNLTLGLVGWDYGTLTLIYSVDSGVLIYESLVPSQEGDIITHELTTMTYPFAMKPTLLDFVLPAATLVLPFAIAIGETRKALRDQKGRRREATAGGPRLRGYSTRDSLYTGLAGALLVLASVFLPWSQLMESQLYLPSSFPTFIESSTLLSLSTSAFVVTSMLAHATAVLAWLGIALEIYTKRKPEVQLVAATSAFVAFASTVILVQAGWPLSWGPLVITVGGILMLTSAFVAWRRKNIGQAEAFADR